MASEIFKKLNLKDQETILVLNAPPSFEPELALLENVIVRKRVEDVNEIHFSLAFVTKQAEVNTISTQISVKTKDDATVWFAYPKGTSKKYTCEFNRDSGWEMLGSLGFEPVRQVAIDEDWSALRFRRVEFIKTMVRKKLPAITELGKKRTE